MNQHRDHFDICSGPLCCMQTTELSSHVERLIIFASHRHYYHTGHRLSSSVTTSGVLCTLQNTAVSFTVQIRVERQMTSHPLVTASLLRAVSHSENPSRKASVQSVLSRAGGERKRQFAASLCSLLRQDGGNCFVSGSSPTKRSVIRGGGGGAGRQGREQSPALSGEGDSGWVIVLYPPLILLL